uniref:Ig-like domain-containing protein n=1 Tax=Phlebotomus papatasi TaxID=29031 RepID=A0A1B0GPA9_PHLPP
MALPINKSNANIVTLRAVTRNQTGTYQCEVSADAPSFHTEVAQATMLVAVLPEAQPSMTVNSLRVFNNKILVRMDESLKMICTSSPSYPPVNFTWSINAIPYSCLRLDEDKLATI